MSSIDPIVTVSGFVREASLATMLRDGQREPFGTRLTILTEPSGGFLDVTIFTDDMEPGEALAFKGCEVTAEVALSARAGRNGGAFLSANASEVTVTREPVAA